MHDFEKRVVDRARSNQIEDNVISIVPVEKTNLIDPLEHPKIKKLITDFFGSGVRRIFQSRNDSELVTNRLLKKEFIPKGGDKSFNVPYGKEAMSCGRETGCWADILPKAIRAGYGLYAPATNIRMPRQISKHGARSHDIYRSYRGSRYMHILIAAWASDLPLTEDMMKNLLDPWFQDKFEDAINKYRQANLISELSEDWSGTPLWYGKSTAGPQIRPTRQQVYVSLEAIIFLYDSIKSVFNNNDETMLDLFDLKNWVHYSNPMPNRPSK